MKRIFNIITWSGTVCLIVVGLWAFQCPEPSIPAGPTATATRAGPTPTPTSVPRPPWWSVDPLFGGLVEICPGVTRYVPVRLPPSWEPNSHPSGFSLGTPDRRSGLRFTGRSARAPGADWGSFPWTQTQWPDQLAARGIAPRTVELGTVMIVTNSHPALYWQGSITNPFSLAGGSVPPLAASHGRYRLQTGGEEEYAGFLTIIPYGQDFLEILAYTPLAEWEEQAPYFFGILASMGETPADWSFEAVLTSDWSGMSSISSSGPGYSMRYPQGWEPERLSDGSGWQVSSSDGQMVMSFRNLDGGDPAALLAGWPAPLLTAPTIEDGEPVTVVGASWPSRVARGQDSAGADVTAGVAYGQIGAFVVEALWYAPSGEAWDGAQETFAGVLASFQLWQSERLAQHDLTINYPAYWNSAVPPAGEGLWASAPDCPLGLVVWVREGGDAAAALAAWDGTSLAGIGLAAPVTLDNVSAVYILDEQQPARTWHGRVGSATDVQGGVAFTAHNGVLLEIVWYAPTDQWLAAERNIFHLYSMISSQ